MRSNYCTVWNRRGEIAPVFSSNLSTEECVKIGITAYMYHEGRLGVGSLFLVQGRLPAGVWLHML